MYKRRKRYGVYFQPTQRDIDWGLYILGRGTFKSSHNDIPDKGRILIDYAIVYIHEGIGTFNSSPERSRELGKGDVIFLHPGIWHKYNPDPTEGWKTSWVIFNGLLADNLYQHGFLKKKSPVINTGIGSKLRYLFIKLESYAKNTTGQGQQLMAICLLSILNCIHTLERQSNKTQKHHRINKAVRHIERMWNKTLDYEELAARLKVSYPHFRRIFKEVTGETPHQYQLNLRINYAKDMLSRGKTPMKYIALESGFQSPHYFSRIFKEKTGVPPSKWQGY